MTQKSTFHITIGDFNGSLGSLLEMVQKRKMHISDVSLSHVADEYIQYVQSLESLPQGQTSEFIVIAATLLLIKSKSLLPSLELTVEEEEDIKELEERLQLYGVYRQASEALAGHIKSRQPLYAPKSMRVDSVHFAPPANVSVDTLQGALFGVLQQLPQVESMQTANIAETIHIEDVMQSLLKRVEGGMQTNFSTITSNDRQEVLVNFLALLELVKTGVLLAQQQGTYGEIRLTK